MTKADSRSGSEWMDPAPRSNFVKRLRSRQFQAVLASAVVLISLLFLGYLIYSNWAALTAHDWQIDYVQLALTLALHLLAYVVAISAWHSIIDRLAGVNNWRLNARVYCFSAVAKRLPGIAWDIAARIAMYDEARVPKALIGLASLLEVILITISGILCYAALVPFTVPYLSSLGSWTLAGALVVGALLIHPRLVTYVVRRVRQDSLPIALRHRDTVRWLFMYALTWIVSGLLFYALTQSFYDLPDAYLLQLIADWTLAGVLTSFITFVPTGLGLKEVTLTLLMSRYVPEYIAVVAATSVRLLTIAYALLWALCSTRLRSPRREASDCPETSDSARQSQEQEEAQWALGGSGELDSTSPKDQQKLANRDERCSMQ